MDRKFISKMVTICLENVRDFTQSEDKLCQKSCPTVCVIVIDCNYWCKLTGLNAYMVVSKSTYYSLLCCFAGHCLVL